jgi:hypothetical protein
LLQYTPEIYRSAIISGVNNQTTSLQVVDLKIFYKELAADLVIFTKKTTLYYDRYYNMEPMLKEGDKIYLIQQNTQTKRLSIKLDYKKLGFFKIKRIAGLVNYKLVLPKTINIHPVFYIFLLELILPGAPPAPITKIELINPNTEYKCQDMSSSKV